MKKQPNESNTDRGIECSTKLGLLRAYLETISPGKIKDTAELEVHLAACWDEFNGSGDHGMRRGKLSQRIYGVEWRPPCVKFDIVRHKVDPRRPSYGTTQRWIVNVTDKTAIMDSEEPKRLYPPSPRLYTKKLAKEIGDIIVARGQDARLEWKSADRVRLVMKELVPYDYSQQTMRSRRKRLRIDLEPYLADRGWLPVKRTSANTYEHTGAADAVQADS